MRDLLMGDSRNLASARSVNSAATSMMLPRTNGENCMAMLRTLYHELEPQMSKSYRPNVVYEPPKPEPETDATKDTPASPKEGDKKSVNKLRTAQIVIDAVSTLQKKKDVTAAFKKKRLGDTGKSDSRASVRDTTLNKGKDVSQSLPNLDTS